MGDARSIRAVADALDCAFSRTVMTRDGFDTTHWGAPGYHCIVTSGPITYRDQRVRGAGRWRAGCQAADARRSARPAGCTALEAPPAAAAGAGEGSHDARPWRAGSFAAANGRAGSATTAAGFSDAAGEGRGKDAPVALLRHGRTNWGLADHFVAARVDDEWRASWEAAPAAASTSIAGAGAGRAVHRYGPKPRSSGGRHGS